MLIMTSIFYRKQFGCRIHSLKRIISAERHYHDLPLRHRDLIPGFLENLRMLRKCTEQNFEIIKLIIADTEFMFENVNRHGLEVNVS